MTRNPLQVPGSPEWAAAMDAILTPAATTEIRQPAGTFQLLHPACATCADLADQARAMATATGSRAATQGADHRAADGTIVIDHSGTWTRTPTAADDADYLAAEQAERAAAQMAGLAFAASNDLARAAALADAAGNSRAATQLRLACDLAADAAGVL